MNYENSILKIAPFISLVFDRVMAKILIQLYFTLIKR